MGLIDFVTKTGTNVIKLPIAAAYDLITLGGTLTDDEDLKTTKVIKDEANVITNFLDED
jgi:hypothetical protein